MNHSNKPSEGEESVTIKLLNCLTELVRLKILSDQLSEVPKEKQDDLQFVKSYAEYTDGKKLAWATAKKLVHQYKYYGVVAATPPSIPNDGTKVSAKDVLEMHIHNVVKFQTLNDWHKSFLIQAMNEWASRCAIDKTFEEGVSNEVKNEGEMYKAAYDLLLFVLDDGSPVDGFRFRELALELRKVIESPASQPPVGGVEAGEQENIIENLRAERNQYREAFEARLEEIETLKQWKESAISVMPDMQEIGRLLGVRVGESIHDKIVPGIERLLEVLEKSVEIIKDWHNMPARVTKKMPQEDIQRMWSIYYDNAPEMKPIREALSTNQREEGERFIITGKRKR